MKRLWIFILVFFSAMTFLAWAGNDATPPMQKLYRVTPETDVKKPFITKFQSPGAIKSSVKSSGTLFISFSFPLDLRFKTASSNALLFPPLFMLRISPYLRVMPRQSPFKECPELLLLRTETQLCLDLVDFRLSISGPKPRS